jgi:hypothetical protein
MAIEFDNEYLRYGIDSDGRNLHFVDKQSGRNYAVPDTACARITRAGQVYEATSASRSGERLQLLFGASAITATLHCTIHDHYLALKVESVSDPEAEELVFAHIPLTLAGDSQEPFAACALALNLQTNVDELPGQNSLLHATCYQRFGFSGARVALIGCPQGELRQVLKEAVTAAPDLPQSTIGGPRALDAPINRGSYLFNFGNVTEDTVDDWIELIHSLGFNQLDFHGGRSFRFGDCHPDPEMYPDGLASLKAVIDRLHAAGIAAGLHTYAFFIDKTCPWVTPVPDPRLAKDARFTLAAPLTADAAAVPVLETTEDMSAVTGFFVRNSATLQIDDELITFTGIDQEKPYAFNGCQRGACGTRPAPHASGAAVHHLKECFGLFVPDPNTTLLAEVATRTAGAFNQCGFDMMYLDALDGEDILGGGKNSWHYGSSFVFELCSRLHKSALLEMSTFHHHLWCVRTRMGAWDHPRRSHKKFIDIHCEANKNCARMFLPANLGWWAVKTWTEAQGEPTFADDIEYLCCKSLGNGAGLSLMGIDPDNVHKIPALPRLAAILKQYETLRHADHFPESIKARLREPGAEFTLSRDAAGAPRLQPVHYDKHKVVDRYSAGWKTYNPFDRQRPGLRIEALMSTGPYDDAANQTLATFATASEFGERDAESAVEVELQAAPEMARDGAASACLQATSRRPQADGAWARVVEKFAPPLDLGAHQGLGVWVHGDGKGEVLNLQLRCPDHVVAGIGEHYLPIDFNGWRYCELIESEGERYAEYSWPYGDAYSIYRESVNYEQVETLELWYNNLPPNDTATCYLSPIKALPLVPGTLQHPTLTLNGQAIVFPVEIESGSYLEFYPPSDCKLYGPQGELIGSLDLQEEMPEIESGENQVEFTCPVQEGIQPRARVTLSSRGAALEGY